MSGRALPILCFAAIGVLALPVVLTAFHRVASVTRPARIEVVREDDALLIRSLFESSRDTPDDLRYQLDVSKRGPSGTSTTRQGGAFAPTLNRTDTLSTVRVGVQAGDTVTARLEIASPEGPLAEANFREIIR
jgi:hypothetical protein